MIILWSSERSQELKVKVTLFYFFLLTLMPGISCDDPDFPDRITYIYIYYKVSELYRKCLQIWHQYFLKMNISHYCLIKISNEYYYNTDKLANSLVSDWKKFLSINLKTGHEISTFIPSCHINFILTCMQIESTQASYINESANHPSSRASVWRHTPMRSNLLLFLHTI